MVIQTARIAAALFISTTVLFTSASAQVLRILPMGDSITDGSEHDSPDGSGGYRGPLYDSLTSAGFTVDYVGTSTVNSGLLVEKEHEGHSGWRINQLDANVTGWFAAIDTPDYVLLHIGTNDFFQTNNSATAINRLDALVLKMANLSPTTHIIVTNLMERAEPENTAIQNEFNPFVQGVVDAHINAGRLVSFLDMRSVVPLSDMPDQLHPNQNGYNKMAAAWQESIIATLDPGDDVPPSIVSAKGNEAGDEVRITFNKSLDESSAEITGNYVIDGGISVLSAELSPGGRQVTLTTSAMILDTTYTLTVNNVQDQVAPTPNSIAASSMVTFFRATPRGYFNNVAESNCYSLLYSLDIPNNPNFGSASVTYQIDNRLRFGEFDRVAYYIELQSPGGDLRYAWASMDAFSSDLEMIGIPSANSGSVFQQNVTNLNVESNVPGVIVGPSQTGNLEFWPANYTELNSSSVPSADDATFDFGDSNSGGVGYGSMQIHNISAAETVMAFNGWNGGGNSDIGIGSQAVGQPDWTLAQNGNSYSMKRIQVLVSSTGDFSAPTLNSAEANFGNDGVTMHFSEPVRAETLLASNFTIDHGVSVLGVILSDDLSTVFLETTTLPDDPLSVTVSNVRDSSQNANLIAYGSTIAVDSAMLPTEILTNIGAAADGYQLLYSIDIPAVGNFNAGNSFLVDNSSGIGSFSRVAYYLELQTGGAPVEYIWTSMDAFTSNPAHLGVPTVASGAFFQTPVTELEVLSNKSGIVTGSGISTGNIEFWPSNYNESNQAAIPNASVAVFDFGDGGAGTLAGYGSMQIHNHGASQTLFAMNNFGNDNAPICLGIGNRSGGQPDWTFADNSASYSRRIMHVMVLPTPPSPVPAEVLANVPESSDYELVYTIDVPANGNLSGGAGFPGYVVDQSSTSDSFSRVAYYLELQSSGDSEPTYVWISMDAFTSERGKIGVPNVASGALWQQLVSNLNIFSNSANVTTGTGLNGNLEFWPGNYTGDNNLAIPGATSAFDFGDGGASPSFGHGSMQVHNYVAGETLFAINNWGSNGNTMNVPAIGIGNNQNLTNNDPDYTYTYNATTYDLRRRLHVLVLPGASPFGGPEIVSVTGSTSLDRMIVTFDREISSSSDALTNFSLDGGLSVTSTILLPENREIALTTSAQTAGASYSLTVNGVQDRSARGTFITPDSAVTFTAYSPASVLVNVPDAGMQLIYSLDIPANKPQWNDNAVTYGVDESKYGEILFDRVAYLMELDGDWVYASFDPYTDQIKKIGVPSLRVSSSPFQQIVSNMNVASNVAGIVTGNDIATGNIEFWGGNYQEVNSLSIPNASSASFDFGDSMTAGAHGSMQVHNHGASQVLFAYNNWGSNVGGVSDLGIGNNTGTGQPDYTFSDSAGAFTNRKLYVFARSGGTASGSAPVIFSQPCDREATVGDGVTFAVSLLGEGPWTYQWRKNGVALASQNSPWLTISSVSATDLGAYDVIVTGSNLVTVTSSPALLSIGGPNALVQWRIDNGFQSEDGSTHGEGDFEDRDSDGLANLLEFGLGTNPNSSDEPSLNPDGSSNGLPFIVENGSGFDFLFSRRDDQGQTGSVTYTVQFSSDLDTFTDSSEIPALVADSAANSDYEIVRVPFPALAPGERKVRFARVLVTKVP